MYRAGSATPPGYRSPRNIQSGVSSQIVDARREQLTDFTWEDYVKAGNVIAGGPETVRQELALAIRELRVGNLMLLLQFGDMPKDLAMKNTELFAREVMPHVRDIWSEYETRWWPQSMMEPEKVL